MIMAKNPTRKQHITRLSKVVEPMIESTAIARGFVLTRLISQWQKIAGDMAAWCQPVELKFTKGEKNNGSLKVSIASGRGPEATQKTKDIISRVNAAFGYAAINRLSFVQTFQIKGSPPEKSENLAPEKQAKQNHAIWALDEKLQKVEAPELRAALRRLGTPIDERTR